MVWTTQTGTFTYTTSSENGGWISIPASIQTHYFTTTITDADGAFNLGTRTTTIINTNTFTEIYSKSYVTTTVTRTNPATYYYTTEFASIPSPTCALPSLVPNCQSSWDAYESSLFPTPIPSPACIDDHPWNSACSSSEAAWASLTNLQNDASLNARDSGTPPCTQATITASMCSSMVSAFLRPADIAFHTPVIDSSVAHSLLAPGCSVGCQQCRVTGSSVKLLFWPPATATGNLSATAASNTGLVTATGYGTTFTSPTVYISFDTLYASDSCSAIGTTYTNLILPIPHSTALSSIWGRSGNYEARAALMTYSTAAFNYTDLVLTPVPNTIYNLQPRCQTSLYGFIPEEASTDNIANFSCARTVPYEPIIALPTEVADLDQMWKGCVGALEGVYDPPTALVPMGAVATPTEIGGVMPVPAVPVMTPPPVTPSPTAEVDAGPTQGAGTAGGGHDGGGDPAGSSSDGDTADQSSGGDPAGTSSSGGNVQQGGTGEGDSSPAQDTPPTSGGPSGSGSSSSGSGGSGSGQSQGGDPSGSSDPSSSEGTNVVVGSPANGGVGAAIWSAIGGVARAGQSAAVAASAVPGSPPQSGSGVAAQNGGFGGSGTAGGSSGQDQSGSGAEAGGSDPASGGSSQGSSQDGWAVSGVGASGSGSSGSETSGDASSGSGTSGSNQAGSAHTSGNAVSSGTTGSESDADTDESQDESSDNESQSPASKPKGAVITFTDGQVLTATSSSGVVLVAGQTLSAGGRAVTFNSGNGNQIISIASNGVSVGTNDHNGQVATFSALTAVQTGGIEGGVIVTAAVIPGPSGAFTAVQNPRNTNAIVVNGTTISIGRPAATLEGSGGKGGEVVSLGTDGVIVSSSGTVSTAPLSAVTVSGKSGAMTCSGKQTGTTGTASTSSGQQCSTAIAPGTVSEGAAFAKTSSTAGVGRIQGSVVMVVVTWVVAVVAS